MLAFCLCKICGEGGSIHHQSPAYHAQHARQSIIISSIGIKPSSSYAMGQSHPHARCTHPLSSTTAVSQHLQLPRQHDEHNNTAHHHHQGPHRLLLLLLLLQATASPDSPRQPLPSQLYQPFFGVACVLSAPYQASLCRFRYLQTRNGTAASPSHVFDHETRFCVLLLLLRWML
jgi:hypothetical protein